jgi:hypothetical protein
VEAATWDNCRVDFAFCAVDGTLVDLLVPGTGPAEWEAFWSALRSGPFELRAFRDHEPMPLPESAAWLMAEQQLASIVVSVLAGGITANCFFYGGDLKLDLDPREIVGESDFESVLAIMRFVAAAVRLPVFAVGECGKAEQAFLRVAPDGQAEFLPTGSVKRIDERSLWWRITSLIPGSSGWIERYLLTLAKRRRLTN